MRNICVLTIFLIIVCQLFFLKDHLYHAEMKIQGGLGHYTWQSLNIREFCDYCMGVSDSFEISHGTLRYVRPVSPSRS